MFALDRQVLVSFSGGKDSLAVLKLCEPYKGRFQLLWANTGYNFPHVEKLIRKHGQEFGLIEVPVDMMPNWQANGWPTEVLTIQSFMHADGPIRLQPWPMCCLAHKSVPITEYVRSLDQPVSLIHGQRMSDGRFMAPQRILPNGETTLIVPLADSSAQIAPIADWSTEQVFKFIEAEGIELPDHYAEVPDSLDCWLCPSHWNGPHALAYAAMIKRRYPEYAAEMLPTVKVIHSALAKSVGDMRQAMEVAA